MAEISSAPPASDQHHGESNKMQFFYDSSHLPITTIKFDGSNYLTWSKSVLIYVQGKDKEEYLTSEMKIPDKSDSKYRNWKTENDMVMG